MQIWIVARLEPYESGLQNVNVLIFDGANYYIWTVHNIDSALADNEVQAILGANINTYLAELATNNEQPLPPEEVADILNDIQIAKGQDIIDAIGTPTMLGTLRYRFASAQFDLMTTADKIILVRDTIDFILATLVKIIKYIIKHAAG